VGENRHVKLCLPCVITRSLYTDVTVFGFAVDDMAYLKRKSIFYKALNLLKFDFKITLKSVP